MLRILADERIAYAVDALKSFGQIILGTGPSHWPSSEVNSDEQRRTHPECLTNPCILLSDSHHNAKMTGYFRHRAGKWR